MNVQLQPLSLGSILAIIVLVLAVVFIAIGHLPLVTGLLIAALAVARLC